MLLLFFTFNSLATLSNKRNCTKKEIYSAESNWIVAKKLSSKRDVSPELDILEKLLDECEGQLEFLKVSKFQLSYLRTLGLKNEYQLARNRLIHYSKFRNVDIEYAKFIEISRKLNLGNYNEEKFALNLLKLGSQSQIHESVSCSTSYDLRPKVDKVLGKNRNQDSMGWCYAFTAADLLSLKLGVRVSGGYVGVRFLPKTFKKFALWASRSSGESDSKWGGNAYVALHEIINDIGYVCLESAFPSEDNNLSDQLKNINENFAALERLKNIVEVDKNYLKCLSDFQSVFPKLTIDEFRNVFMSSTQQMLITNLAIKSCEKKENQIKVPKTLTTHSVNFLNPLEDKTDVFNMLDEQLKKGNASSLAFNGNLFYDPDSNASESVHEGLVIGRRFNQKTGDCEYLFRNSWGPQCSLGAKLECENGNYWVPKSVISRSSTARGTYLE